jgi:hypothetical protein
MAIAFGSALTSGTDETAGATSFSTASVTPAPATVVFLFAYIDFSADGEGATAPSVSGAGMTWTLQKNQPQAAATRRRIIVWTGVGTPTAGAITVTRAGSDTWNRALWSVFEFSGANTTTPLVAANSVGGDTNSDTQSLSYAQAFAAGSAGVSGWVNTAGASTATPRANWAEVHDIGIVSWRALETQYYLSADSAGSVLWTDTGDLIGIAVELAAAAGTPPMFRGS